MEITHAFVTHTHPDHVGGRFAGVEIEGVTELLSKCKAKVVCTKRRPSFSRGRRRLMSSRQKAATRSTSAASIQLLHTPGHAGVSMFLVDNKIVSGTRFSSALAGASIFREVTPSKYYSLTQKLMALPDDTILFPGHNYTANLQATLGERRRLTLTYAHFVKAVSGRDGAHR